MSTTTLGKDTRGSFALWMVILVVLAVLGAVAWGIQLTQGMSVTGISQTLVWGLYIGTFFLLAGTASGFLFLAALGHLEVIPGLDRYRRDLLVASVGAYIAAGIVILMDIGHPERVLQFLTSPKFTSPFVWDFYTLAVATGIALIYLLLTPKGKGLAWIAGIVSLLVVIAEGLLMSVNGARPVWHSPLTPILFVIEAAVTSSALVYLAIRDEKVSQTLMTILRLCLPTLLVLTFIEVVTVMYGGEPEAKEAITLLLTGNLAPLFWIQIAGGLVLPFVVLVSRGLGKTITNIAAILAILGVLLAKLNLLVAGQAYPLLQRPEFYTPSLAEAGGVIGVVALAILLFALGRRVLPSKA
jgi:molybdopterin-containing oxidoreductase family membrane subunit